MVRHFFLHVAAAVAVVVIIFSVAVANNGKCIAGTGADVGAANVLTVALSAVVVVVAVCGSRCCFNCSGGDNDSGLPLL